MKRFAGFRARKNRSSHAPWTGVALIVIAMVMQHELEARMVLHMLVQFPLLILGAGLLADQLPMGFRKRLAEVNQLGISGLTFAVTISSLWMIPRALDLAVQVAWVDALKILTLVAVGTAIRLSWTQAALSLQAFFLIGWAMMTATIGLLYQDAPIRLCTSYLSDEQTGTGIGLVALSSSLVLVWFGQCLKTISTSHQQG